jgi:hypothetical protein
MKPARHDVHKFLTSQKNWTFSVLRDCWAFAIVPKRAQDASNNDMRGAHTTNKITASRNETEVISFPEAYHRLTAEQALRVAIDTQVFAVLRDLEPLDGGRAVQAVYVALLRRIPNVTPDRKRIAIDSGFSDSSVKRAIGLLERCRLITVERQKGRGSTYEITDLRSSEAASVSLSMIRKLAREVKGERTSASRATCEPTDRKGRVISEPTPRVTSDHEVGSLAAQKEASKDQAKQQRAACLDAEPNLELRESLRRWGLSSAGFIVRRGHPKAIPLLVSNIENAARLIDRTMTMATWSPSAGVGARVAHIRDHVAEAAAGLEAEGEREWAENLAATKRAEFVALSLPQADAACLDSLNPGRKKVLLERAAARLDEPNRVIRQLLNSTEHRQRLIASEVVRERLEEELDAMSEADFDRLCSRFFTREPGLRRFYADGNRKSSAFRLHLLAFMAFEWKDATSSEAISSVREGRGETGVFVPNESPSDTPVEPAACTRQPYRNLPCDQASVSRRRLKCPAENQIPSRQGA